jgi:hypothetical protein
MEITNAKKKITFSDEVEYTSIQAVIDGKEWSVPMDPLNRHYKEILRQTKSGKLVIGDEG